MTNKNKLFARAAALTLALAGLTQGALAQPGLQVQNAWVRATVAQQKSTGAFMQLSSAQGGRLLEVRSPVAEMVEIHEMRMDGTVMKMRAMPALDLPAGQSVELKPGGYHIMMMGLKAPVKAGDSVPLSLVFEAKDGKRETVELKAQVRAMAPMAEMGHGQHQH